MQAEHVVFFCFVLQMYSSISGKVVEKEQWKSDSTLSWFHVFDSVVSRKEKLDLYRYESHSKGSKPQPERRA